MWNAWFYMCIFNARVCLFVSQWMTQNTSYDCKKHKTVEIILHLKACIIKNEKATNNLTVTRFKFC